MLNYTPNIHGRSIVMISDYVETGYDAEDLAEEKMFLAKIEKDLAYFGINFYWLEVKTLEELKVRLAEFDKDTIVIFNWCEEIDSKTNSSQEVTAFLESADYVYAGADTKGLLLSEDRKNIYNKLKTAHVNFPKIYYFDKDLSDIKFPVIVKALGEHGSYGMSDKSILETPQALAKLINFGNCDKFYMEEFINGREFSVTVWGNEEPEALPIIEILFNEKNKQKYKIQDYDSKWNKNDENYLAIHPAFPENLNAKTKLTIRSECEKAYKACELCGFARIEVRLGEKDNLPYIIDMNPNPNFRPHTSLMMATEISGYNEGQVVAKLCEFALEKFAYIY